MRQAGEIDLANNMGNAAGWRSLADAASMGIAALKLVLVVTNFSLGYCTSLVWTFWVGSGLVLGCEVNGKFGGKLTMALCLVIAK